jgi:hypothetical protein
VSRLSAHCYALLAACSILPAAKPLIAGTFEQTVAPVLKANCTPCHDAATRTSGFSVSDLKSVVLGGARHGVAVKPGDPEQSVIVQMLKGEITPAMPFGKNLAPTDLTVIEDWIRHDAAEISAQIPKQAKYWAFVKPQSPDPPQVRNQKWVRNPIDNFILARLEQKGLRPSEEASRRVLIRRLYYDLIGIPPEPSEVTAFLGDQRPDAYEKLVERLLADPRYGERWGRHWLDLARYADTNGYEGDPEWPHAWRYRDYVIDAFNSDKPYDEFIKEQIAGDEFYYVNKAVPPPAPEPEKVVALSFLRLAPFNRTPVSAENRDSLLSEMTSTVGSVFLGLTVGCAKCHNHKYDSIPTRDFYRMKAFFATVQIENTGRAGGYEPAVFYRPGEKEWTDQKREQWEAELKAVEADFKGFQKPLLDKLTAQARKQKPDAKEATEKELEQAVNVENNNAASLEKKDEVLTAVEKQEYRGFAERISRLKKDIERVEPKAMGLRNADGPPFGPEVPTTFVLIRGDYDHRGDRVEPGFLSAVTGNEKPAVLELDRYKMFPTRGRRMTLAKWIASPDNPLTARVMVNRLWQHHFGHGIVETASDFGRNGSPPTHPELLDWLATKFIGEKWSVKAMQRLILESATYRQSSLEAQASALEADPEDHLLWRFNRLRLEGDVIRDSVLAVAGSLNPERGGLPVYPPLPKGLDEKVQSVDTWETSSEIESRRRSIYIFQRRAQYVPFLETFDAPVLNSSCERRRNSITALQALSMYDSDFVNREAPHFAARVKQEAGDNKDQEIRRAFEIAFGRDPTQSERADVTHFLSTAKVADPLVALCRVLLNSNEFLYVD